MKRTRFASYFPDFLLFWIKNVKFIKNALENSQKIDIIEFDFEKLEE